MFMDIFQMGCVSCTAVYMGLLHVPARTPLVGTYLLRQDIMVINARYIFIGSGALHARKLNFAPARPTRQTALDMQRACRRFVCI